MAAGGHPTSFLLFTALLSLPSLLTVMVALALRTAICCSNCVRWPRDATPSLSFSASASILMRSAPCIQSKPDEYCFVLAACVRSMYEQNLYVVPKHAKIITSIYEIQSGSAHLHTGCFENRSIDIHANGFEPSAHIMSRPKLRLRISTQNICNR